MLKHKSGENEKSVLGGVKLRLKLMLLIVCDRVSSTPSLVTIQGKEYAS